MTKKSKPAAEPEKPATLREYFDSFIVTVILALFGVTFVLQAFKIPSSSMEDTLLIGDHLVVNKFVHGYNRGGWVARLLPYSETHRGQVVVFKFPANPSQHYVKRVIGLPGDRLKIVNRQLYINGQPLDEPYKIHKQPIPDSFRDNFPPEAGSFALQMQADWADEILGYQRGDELLVPPGNYFVMGDNRDASADSRYWGFVDRGNIVGRPVLVYWSFNSTADDFRQAGVESRLGRLFYVFTHFFSETRWDRTFRIVR